MAFMGSGYIKLHLLTQLKTHIVYLIVLVGLCGTCSYSKEVLRLGYLTGSSKGTDDLFYDKPGQSISGAITLAVDEVNNSTEILPNHELQFIIAETHGEALRSIRESVVLMDRNISAYIGPQETCLHEARLAAAFNLPMISYFCTNHEVSDKNQFPTFARTKPHDSQISKALVALMKHYNWNKLVFIHTDTKYELAETIQQVLAENDIAVTESHSFDGPYFGDTVITESPFIEIVQETYQKTRVYVMLADFYEFEGLLIALKLRGLIDTGEYIVIGVDSKQYDLSDPQKYIQGLLRKEESPQVTAAFQGFLLIAPAAPVYPWFENFTRIVNYYLEAPPFNFKNPFKDRNVLKILRAEAAYLYDAVWIYARAADRAIHEGQQPSDGRAIYSYIQGTTYESAMGYMNHIDMNGDSEGNFTLLARKPGDDPDRGYGLYPVGTFLLNQNTSIPNLQLKDGETVEWIGGEAPLDEPPCGFVGEFCIPVPGYTKQIVGGTLGGLLVLVNIVAVIAYRTWRYEQELASLMWKIDPRDVVVTSHTSQYSGSSIGIARMGSALRASMVSLTSQADLDLRQVFTQVGTYRGSIVALKPIRRKNIDLSRDVRKELKMVRDIRHDNLNPFIGASIDPGNTFIISEYCSKGSLQDILENDDYKLDNMFIASLVFDILRGMIHLHDSEIRIHGRLKSSNCVVDSRWVLKITDYGLTSFIGGLDIATTSEHTHYQGLLSTAPEILRNPSQFPKGTQKGDIYSFAIVLYEIMSRSSPYEDLKLTPKEIVIRLLKNGDDIQLRPKLSALGSTPKFVTDCINDCWQDDPTLRPDFKTVRRRLKGLQKGMKPNIFDNMMAIMEKYATNLESIVDERTDQLREEKKKTEELLHQMLPCSVAEQLKQGKRVEAEAFDCVTIYFSDICGFTALSSESSPMQIVDLLNDLYTTFDSIIENYDVYKVETIGDAYMVVSGLPKLNGQQHAGEIASMSLHLLNAINKFKLRHRPHDALKLRIGIHSGPCVAGVVGLKMPRYCLFGDTVNTASRMESNGMALKIHCSQECKALLDELGGYQVEERGLVAMKGKGELLTYWVVGEDPARRMKRLALPRQTPKTHHMSRSLLKPSIALHKIPSLPALRTDDITFDGYSPDCHDSGCGPTYNSSKVPNGVNFPDMEGSKENLASDVWRCDHELTRKSHKPSSNKWGGSSKINFEDETNPKLTKLHDASRRNPQWHSTKECSSNKDSRRNHEGLPLLQRSGSAIDNRYCDLLPNGCDAVC